jgi:Tol biopolymer transport system component
VLFTRGGTGGKPDWYVVSPDGGDPQPTGAFERLLQQDFLPTVQDSFIAEAWHPGGNALVFSARLGDSTNLWRIPLSPDSRQVTGRPSRLTHGTGTEAQASFAADGSLVFSTLVENFDIWALPVDSDRGLVTGEMAPLTRNASVDYFPTISADGARMVFLSDRSGNWDVWTKDLTTGGESNLSATPVNEIQPVFSADGFRVAYMVLREGADLNDLYVDLGRGGVARKLCDGCVAYLSDWSPDGQSLIVFRPSRGILRSQPAASLFTVESGKTITMLAEQVMETRFSPDGRWLAFHTVAAARERRQVFIAPFRTTSLPIERREWIPITDDLGSDGRPAWSPDGNLLYFLSDRDGYRCIWAQRLDAGTKKPIGAPIEVYHLHSAGRSLVNVDLGEIGLSVARGKIAITVRETSGNIWLRKVARRD